MTRPLALLLMMLSGMAMLFVWLLSEPSPAEAGNSGGLRPPASRVRAGQPTAGAPFLSQMAHLEEAGAADWLDESSPAAAGVSETRVAAGGAVIPLLDVAMDWSVSSAQWRRALVTLTDERVLDGLRDDKVKWNATVSASILRARLRVPDSATTTRRALETAFEAPDADDQLRRLSAGLLQAHSLYSSEHDLHEPGAALLDYSTELLARGVAWQKDYGIAGAVSGRQSVAFALQHLERMAPRIAQALTKRGPEASFAHAFLLGKGGYEEYVHLAAPVLVEHLRDNNQMEDALMSLEALRALGDKADPWLWSTLRRGDEQQSRCIRLLLEDAGKLGQLAESVHAKAEPLTWKFKNPVGSWSYLENSQR